jgi:hypothetical protein
MPLLVSNAVRKGKASQREPGHGHQTPQSRHQQQMLVEDWEKTSTESSARLPLLENCLVHEGLNEQPYSQRLQPMWYYNAHTQGGQAVLNSNDIQVNGNMPLLLGNAVRKGQSLKIETVTREVKHHNHDTNTRMLVGNQ